jgi:hypothetical protein
MEPQQVSNPNEKPEEQAKKRIRVSWRLPRRAWVPVGAGILFVLLIAAVVVESLAVMSLRDRVIANEWNSRYPLGVLLFEESSIVPRVNIIQFLKRGYTIELEEVSFTQDGLKLAGYFGNPTNLWLYSVGITFSACKTPSFEDYKNSKLREGAFGVMVGKEIIAVTGEQIGSAQSQTIPSIEPGKRGSFQVTIPNVRQGKDSFEIWVSLSGERYSYQ